MFNKLLTLSLFGFLSFSLSAQEDAVEAKKVPKHSCKKVTKICIAAGYTKGKHKDDHKSLKKDCLAPLMEGKSVQGVTITPEEVENCKIETAKIKKAGKRSLKLEMKRENADADKV